MVCFSVEIINVLYHLYRILKKLIYYTKLLMF